MPSEEVNQIWFAIKSELMEFRAEMRERGKRQDELLGDHHLTLFGDGNGSPGLRMRVDRLEQTEAERKIWIGAAITAGIGAAVTGVWNLFHIGGGKSP